MVTLLRTKQTLDPEEFRWKLTYCELKPLWFNGDQFFPLFIRCSQGKKTDGIDGDSENSDPDDGPPKKKPRAQTSIIKSKEIKQITKKRKKGYEKKGNDTKDKLLPTEDSGEEADEELFTVQQTLQLQHATHVVKMIGRFQTFCQVTIHVTSGCPEDYYYIVSVLLL